MREKIMKIVGMIMIILFVIFTIYFVVTIQNFGIIPNKYLLVIYLVNFLLLLFSSILVTRKNIVVFIIGIISTIVISSGYFIAVRYINTFNEAISNIVSQKATSVNYYVVVKKDSEYKEIEDLTSKKVLYMEDNNSVKLSILVSKRLECELALYHDYNQLLNDFMKGSPIIVNSAYLDAMEDEIVGFSDVYQVIYTFTVEEEIDTNAVYRDITSESMLIYLSGIDTYGDVSNRSRSDVNILIAVNPRTHKVLLVNTPRDYYVQLHGTTGLKDKLTHAGIYGIEKSLATMEDLYQVDIHNYIRVNFNTLIKIVDYIGGIDIVSDTEFDAWTNKNVHVKKGLNHFNGEEALAYSRERYSYASGDRHRGENQQQVITAIIEKITNTKTLISKYDQILDMLSNSFETDLTNNSIKTFAKMQLDQGIKWNIEAISVDGDGSNEYTYSMGSKNPLYVMVPNYDTVKNAQEKIEKVLYEK